LEDFPEKALQHLDLNKVQQQAVDRLGVLCKLLESPPEALTASSEKNRETTQ